MNKLIPFLKGLTRHSISVIAGLLVSFGIFSQTQSVEIIGYITALIATIQSVSSSTKEDFTAQFQGAVRHILTFLGGVGFMKGWFSSELFIEVGAAVSTLVGVAWSYMAKKNLPELPNTTPTIENPPS